MTYGLSTKGKQAQVSEQLAASNLPDAAKSFVAETVAVLAGADDKTITVSISGHADESSFSGSFNISAEAAVAETEQSDAKVAASDQAKEA